MKKLPKIECGHAHPFHDSYPLIVNGKPVKPPNKYPWVVALDPTGTWSPNCAGAIINENFILTAAHCLLRSTEISVYLNEDHCLHTNGEWGPCYIRSDNMQIFLLSNSTDILAGVRAPVAEIFIHPKSFFYTVEINNTEYKHQLHDIALLKMKEPIQCSDFANPICLPPQNYRHPTGSVVGINGWGERRKPAGPSRELLEAQMEIINEEPCATFVPLEEVKEYAYCLYGEGNRSVCYGDSGGAMIAKSGNRYYATGVATSHASPDCDPTFPAIYTSVSAHMDWIMEVTSVVPRNLS